MSTTTQPTPARVSVPVVSALSSKINWGEAIKVVAGALALFGVDMPAETRADILAGIIGVGAVYTWVMRTWFTKSVTVSSAGGGPAA